MRHSLLLINLLAVIAVTVVRGDECSGHGSLHGNHCHCVTGYKSKGLECVPIGSSTSERCPAGGIHWELSALVYLEKGSYTIELIQNDDDMATMVLPLKNVTEPSMLALEHSIERSIELLEDITLARKLIKAQQVVAPTDKLLYVIQRNNAEALATAKVECEKAPGSTWHLDHCDGPNGHADHRRRRLADSKMTVNLTVSASGIFGLHMQHDAIEEFGMQLLTSANKPIQITLVKTGTADDHSEKDVSTGSPRKATAAVWWKTMLAVFIVAILSLSGILLLSLREALLQRLMDALMALSSGALFGAAFIHILPEAIEFYSAYGQMELALGLIFSGGFVGAMVLEMLLEVSLHKLSGSAHHHHHHYDHHRSRLSGRESAVKLLSPANPNGAKSDEASPVFADVETAPGEHTAANTVAERSKFSLHVDWAMIRPMAYIILVGDLFHNFVDGVLIATAFLACDDGLGIAVTASAILHEVPQEFADFIILIDAGFTTFQAILFNFVSALSAFLGAFIILAAVQVTKETMGGLLGFGAGTLVYIAATDLLPRVLRVTTFRAFFVRIVLFCIGIGILALTTLYHVHCEAEW